MERKLCTDANLSAVLDFMKAGKCVSLSVLINACTAAALLRTPVSASRAGAGPTAPVHVTSTIGVLTVAAVVSAKTELCVTPLLEPATVPLGSRVGAVRNAVTRVPMATIATRSASAKMEPAAIMSQENAGARPVTPEPSVRIFALLVNMGHSVRKDVRVRMVECATMLLENVHAHLDGWAQFVASLALRVDMEGIAPRSVSATTEEHATQRQGSVAAAPATRENGARMSAQSVFME